MSKTAVQIALEKAEEFRAKERRELEIMNEETARLEQHRKELTKGVAKALAEFEGVEGCAVSGNTLKVGWRTITVTVEEVCGKTRYSDDSDEFSYRGYVIRWTDGDAVYGGVCTLEDFHKDFGRHVAMYLK
jgi:hypothetical protein